MISAFVPDATTRPSFAALSRLLRAARWLIPERRDGIVALALVLVVWWSNVFGVLALVEGLRLDLAAYFAIENLGSTLVWFLTAASVARWSVGWKVAGWRHDLLLALALAAALAASAVGQIAFARLVPNLTAMQYEVTVGLGNANAAVPLSIAAFWFPLGLLLAAQFRRSAQERSARARLDALLREQRQAQRRFAESRLQRIQSRIDPELLFEMLEHLGRLYRSDAARAERLLDELIDFLRAVLPRLLTTTSTLERELAIAMSYVRLRSLAEDSAAGLDAALPAALAGSAFPPGVLLPLVDALLRRSGSGGSIRIAAERRGAELLVRLSAGATPPGPALATVRARLDELFGNRCRLEPDPLDRNTLVLTLPDEDRRA